MPTIIPESNEIVSAIPELEGEVDAARFMQTDMGHLLVWGLIGLIILVAVVTILWIRHSRRKNKAPQPTPLETARTALQELEERLPTLRECSLQVSFIVRRYLEGQVQDPALYETHEEFSQRLDSLATVPKDCQYDTRYLLEKLADMKYAGAKEQDPVQARTLIEQAGALLSRIEEARQQATAETKAPPIS